MGQFVQRLNLRWHIITTQIFIVHLWVPSYILWLITNVYGQTHCCNIIASIFTQSKTLMPSNIPILLHPSLFSFLNSFHTYVWQFDTVLQLMDALFWFFFLLLLSHSAFYFSFQFGKFILTIQVQCFYSLLCVKSTEWPTKAIPNHLLCSSN